MIRAIDMGLSLRGPTLRFFWPSCRNMDAGQRHAACHERVNIRARKGITVGVPIAGRRSWTRVRGPS